MATLLQLIEMEGGIVARNLDSNVYEWMRQTSSILDNIAGGGATAEVRYVNKGGSDTTGDGSFDNPFLTIQAALTSITDATQTKPYSVQVAPGVYTDTFALKPWCYVEGIDGSAVYLNPVTANWIGAGFAAAGTLDTGITNVTLQTNLTVDFSLVASPGAGSFKLRNVLLDTAVALVFKGNNAANVVNFQNILSIGPTSSPLTLTNIQSSGGAVNLRNGTLTISSTDAYATTHRFSSIATGGAVNVTWTGAVTANPLSVNFLTGELPVNPTTMTIVGAGAAVYVRGLLQVTGPNADTTFSFGRIPNAGTVILAQGADNNIIATPTADRTYSLEGGGAIGTRCRITNQSAFVITIAYVGGASGIAGMSTYVGPFQTVDLYASTIVVWNARTLVQTGVVTLTSGVSALIPADIVLESRIVATLKDINGGVLGVTVSAKLADRVVGTRAAGGGFKLTSITAAGVTVATDNGIYDWHIMN